MTLSRILAALPGRAWSSSPPPGGPAGRYLTSPGAYTARLARLLLAILEHQGPAAGPLLAAAVAAVVAGRAWLRRRQHAAFAADARTVTILSPPQADPDGAAALWGHLTGLLRPPRARLLAGQPHLGWEYTWNGGTTAGLSIRLWVPGTIPPGMIERAVEAAWPGTHTITSAASPPLPPGALTAGGTLRLARPEILPLSVSHDPDAPLRALAGAAAGLGDGEHAIVQVLARPVTGARLRRARRAARKQRAGQPARLSSRLLDLATPGGHASSGTRRTASRTDPELAAEIRAATEKLASPQWETLIRYATATTAAQVPDGAGRWQARAATAQAGARLRGLAHALASATALYTGRNWLARRRLRHPAEAINTRRLRRGDLLSVPELAAIARLPADPALPGLARAGARAVAPPPAIPLPGPDVRPLGVSDTGKPRPVGLAVADGRHHMRICGPTGTGKTTLIAGQILSDAAAGRGVVFIDPKGDAVTDIIARLPEQAAGKVVLFDPEDRAAPPCLNVLQGDGSGTDTDVIIDNVTGIFRRIFAASWGPRTDDIFRSACLTLLGSVPPGSGLVTLADIPALLGDDAYRHRLTAGIRDPVLRGFWDWYEQLSVPTRAHSIGPLMNKLRAFLLRRFARQAIAAGPSTFDMADVLDHGGLCLARLPKGILGEETAQLVGSFIVARTWQAASRRARIPETARPDAGLYIDEAQNFLNLPYPLEDMLAEARAYRLSVTMAHQNLAQLPAGPAAGDLRERPLPGHLLGVAGRRPRPGTPHRPGTDRPRPVPPGRLPGRRPAGRRPRRDPRLHPAHPAAAPACPRPRPPHPPRRPRRPRWRHRRHSPAARHRRRRPPAAPRRLTTTCARRRPACPPTPALPGRPRAAGRLARGPELAASLAARLTARDRWLLRMLHEHRVLTTTQITQLAFGTTRAATARLLTLYQHRAVDRFRPLAPAGSAPLHFILDEAGAQVLAAEDGITTAELGYRRDRALAIALSAQLAHTTGANGFFTALAAAARASSGQAALGCWWSERRCAAVWGDLARPDGYGRWREQLPGHAAVTADFFLEFDNGTENLARLIAKLAGYAGPGRPHRHPHPGAVLAAHRAPGSRAARPPRRPASARHARRRLGRRDPRRPGRHRRPRHRSRRPGAGRGGLAARRKPRAAAAAGPARPGRPARPRRGSADGRAARRPGVVSPRPRPARLARPPRHTGHPGGQ